MSRGGARTADLETAQQERSLVRITRSPKNADRIDGFILSQGAKWLLIAATRDGGYTDGFVAVRLNDMVKVEINSTFEERFARSQPEWPPTPPTDVELDKTRHLITSLSKTSELVGIEQEGRFKSAMQWIGAVDEIVDGWLWLREVRPGATWREEPLGYKLSRISKVTVSNAYQSALSAVAGPPPQR